MKSISTLVTIEPVHQTGKAIHNACFNGNGTFCLASSDVNLVQAFTKRFVENMMLAARNSEYVKHNAHSFIGSKCFVVTTGAGKSQVGSHIL